MKEKPQVFFFIKYVFYNMPSMHREKQYPNISIVLLHYSRIVNMGSLLHRIVSCVRGMSFEVQGYPTSTPLPVLGTAYLVHAAIKLSRE